MKEKTLVVDYNQIVQYKNLLLVNIILIVIAILQPIAIVINVFFGALSISILVITLLLLRRELQFHFSKLASLASLVASGLTLIAAGALIYMMIIVLQTDYADIDTMIQAVTNMLSPATGLNVWRMTLNYIGGGLYFVAGFGYYFRFQKLRRFIKSIDTSIDKQENQ
ncbi:hypothetical protein [Culicoidibacter larvae]|nr:hypothetical protein [Culicoidibacter larvae]